MIHLKKGIHRVSGKDVLVETDKKPTEGKPASENTVPSEVPELPGIPLTRLKEGVHRISGQDVVVEPEPTPPAEQPGDASPAPTTAEAETTPGKKSAKLPNEDTKTDLQNNKP